jgi:hypothetical protein
MYPVHDPTLQLRNGKCNATLIVSPLRLLLAVRFQKLLQRLFE